MFKFVKIQRNDLPDKHISWMCLIDTIESALAYTELRAKTLAGHYWRMKGKLIKTGKAFHNFNRTEDAMEVGLGARNQLMVEQKKRPTLATDCEYLDRWAQSVMRLFMDTGSVLVNENGGCFSPTWIEVEILETVKRKGFLFPKDKAATKKDIRVIQWQGGKHFYAKIGNNDVIVDGEQKWDTYQLAEAAAKEYLKEIK